jgi:ATP-dependent DNA helicase RecG
VINKFCLRNSGYFPSRTDDFPWGRGIELILSKEHQTSFKEVGRQFIVVFERKNVQPQRLVEGLVDGLAENQRRILDILQQDAGISKRELSDNIGISTTAIDKNISVLKKKKLLRRIGPDKGGRWEVRR